jgi:polar amino acid transport system permease protein
MAGAISGGPGDSGLLIGLSGGGGPGRYDRSQRGSGALRSTLVAFVSTLIFLGVVVALVVNAPGWPDVQRQFLNGKVFADSAPLIVRAFWVNVQLFLVSEVLILGFGLVIAVLRSLPGPVLFPVRLLATIYVDVFRALPGILIIYVLGFGISGLGVTGVSEFVYAVFALTLIYSAYVSEVYRAGINSIHPSQDAAARSLGMSRFQALRHVVVPQAVRRVVPPLLNDFIGLQKDTVLVSYIGVVEIFRQAQIRNAGSYNFTPYIVVALVFLLVTIPLARLTDVLVARDQRRSAAGAR